MNINKRLLTRNIAKSGEVLNWSDFFPFQLHLSLIEIHSQSASCHIATVRLHIFEYNTSVKFHKKRNKNGEQDI